MSVVRYAAASTGTANRSSSSSASPAAGNDHLELLGKIALIFSDLTQVAAAEGGRYTADEILDTLGRD